MALMLCNPLLILLLLLLLLGNVTPEENLYQILGVQKTATAKEIKKAYRRRALESHPDKNQHLPPEQATEEFHKVALAFEILSDKDSRAHYDRTGSTNTKARGGRPRRPNNKNNNQSPPKWPQGPKRVPLKDQPGVKEAMDRVLHIVSFQQLRTIMLKDEEVHVTTTEQVDEQDEQVFHQNDTMVITKQTTVTKTTKTTFTIQHETVERHLVRF